MGFRAPSLKEQYLFFVDGGTHNVQGNPNLTAETSSNWLASVAYQLPFEKIFERFKHLQKKIYKLVVFFNLDNKTEIILKFRANG
jgi:outer membrane receptor protein involved in Fe transport